MARRYGSIDLCLIAQKNIDVNCISCVVDWIIIYLIFLHNRSKCNDSFFSFSINTSKLTEWKLGWILGSKQYYSLFSVLWFFAFSVLGNFLDPRVFYLFGPLDSVYGPSSQKIGLVLIKRVQVETNNYFLSSVSTKYWMSPVVNFLVMIEYKFVKIKLEINFSVVKLLFIESFTFNFCEKNKYSRPLI